MYAQIYIIIGTKRKYKLSIFIFMKEKYVICFKV